MKVSVYGETDKRAVIYTLMNIFQTLGDTWLVSDDRHFKRLIEDRANEGSYQNILISVADTTEDEVYADLGHIPEDFDFIIFDNLQPIDVDLIFYVKGERTTEEEQFVLDTLDNYVTIELGFGKKGIPYSTKMFKNIEHVECSCDLVEIDPKVSKVIIKAISPLLNIPEATLGKVVQRH